MPQRLRRYEGNPCNSHLLGLGQKIKQSIFEAGLTGYQFGTVGVSDGISMGTDAMSYSLPSRDRECVCCVAAKSSA